MHTYTGGQGDVNFNGTDVFGWDWIGDGLLASGEAFAFYMPLINDPVVSGTWFAAGQHVFRTKDNGGPQDYLDQHCNEFFGDFSVPCGDWEALGVPTLTGTFYGEDKRTATGNYVVAVARASSNTDTLWAATRRGRVFVSTNASATPASSAVFTRIDTALQPNRFISSIGGPANPTMRSYRSPAIRRSRPPSRATSSTCSTIRALTASWTEISSNLGDQPVTSSRWMTSPAACTRRPIRRGRAAARVDGPGARGRELAAGGRVQADHRHGRASCTATHGRGAFRLDLSLPDNDLVASRD